MLMEVQTWEKPTPPQETHVQTNLRNKLNCGLNSTASNRFFLSLLSSLATKSEHFFVLGCPINTLSQPEKVKIKYMANEYKTAVLLNNNVRTEN